MEKTPNIKKVDGNDNTMIKTWLHKHSQIYSEAIRHPFIQSINDGTVNLSSFKQWLGQDYIFVRKFVSFVASVLLKACRASDDGLDMEVILGGIASLNDEISWFKKETSKWDLLLSNITPRKENQGYCRFIESLTSSEVDYTVAMTAFWAIEAVYQESFSYCLQEGAKPPAELMDTCQRWGNDDFGQYCRSLQRIADRCLAKASKDVQNEAEAAVVSILKYEVGFWNMSLSDL
ncbi:hypothetical protein GIB67_028738 [Kingdonia uniflora]|uniref:aminopyrimidine aminohydrolase n=1 Tax=Kingdonia uniflora TaxID=39325 RepID=A0A7J7NAG7_9MAGN|nr:hypothetical protein GIB67_028738 [Kingdonia uniflora]